MDKKFLAISLIVIVLILLAGFGIYQYIAGSTANVQNSAGGAQTENNAVINTPQIQIQAGGIEAQGESDGGSLTICMDQCGNGVCQQTNTTCSGDNNLNCICQENVQDCPQDCK
jgi:hypothetical protein